MLLASIEELNAVNDRRNLADTLMALANTYICTGDAVPAIEQFKKAVSVLTELNDEDGLARANGGIGIALTHLDNAKSREYMSKAIAYHTEKQDYADLARLKSQMIRVERDSGHLEKALDYGLAALKLIEEHPSPRWEAITRQNMVGVYMEMGRIEDAMLYARQAIELFRSMGDIRGLGIATADTGSLYFVKQDMETAEKLYLKAMPILESVLDYRYLGLVFNNLCSLYGQRGELKRALEFSEKALTIHRKTLNARSEAITLKNQVLIKLYLGECNSAT